MSTPTQHIESGIESRGTSHERRSESSIEHRESSIEHQVSSIRNQLTNEPINQSPNLIMQNKAKLRNDDMNVTPYITMGNENFRPSSRRKNEAKQTQNKPNFSSKLGSFFQILASFYKEIFAFAYIFRQNYSGHTVGGADHQIVAIFMQCCFNVRMFKNISIIGDGAMATVLAMLLAEKNIPVRVWGYDAAQLRQIEQSRENVRFLPGYKLSDRIGFEPADERIMKSCDFIVCAVPCQFTRAVFDRLKIHIPADVPILSVTKGIENDTLLRPTQVLADVLGPVLAARKSQLKTAVLSGPTVADELARKLPATACVASGDNNLAKEIQYTFNTEWLRLYTNTDLVGVELAAACKNVIAIAAGIIDGIGAGDNAKAALLSRGLAEITRLGIACGAKPQTFAGLTGLGDLVTTCISPKGRNRSFGERIGKGLARQKALAATHSVVEGVATCKSVVALAKKYNVEMPITEAVNQILFENKPVRKAIRDLMTRKLKSE